MACGQQLTRCACGEARPLKKTKIQHIRPTSGAHDRDRTGDLVLTKDVLYQLSYVGRSLVSWSG